MSDKTKIEWTQATWNPTTGCTKVSQGCKNCYAERLWNRFITVPESVFYRRAFTDVRCHPERLDIPLRWRKPRRIFVDSMSDLFHPDVPDEFIFRIFSVMNQARQHVFQVLTKRPERLVSFLPGWQAGYWPIPNVWLGVSVEDQKTADERIPLLLQTPAVVRFVSCEPLLGPVDLQLRGRNYGIDDDFLNWVICGGESGPGARPMHPDWARSLRDQCQAAGVPFFFKQWGKWLPEFQAFIGDLPQNYSVHEWNDTHQSLGIGKRLAGRLLDGREWNEIPERSEDVQD